MRRTTALAALAAILAMAAVPAFGQSSPKRLLHARHHAFTFCELQKLWSMVGPRRYSHTMARLAIAESGGLPWVGSSAAGLWQIQGRPFRGDPRDPRTNARMALAKLRASHWSVYRPWAGSRGLPGSGYSDHLLVRRFGRAGFGHCRH